MKHTHIADLFYETLARDAIRNGKASVLYGYFEEKIEQEQRDPKKKTGTVRKKNRTSGEKEGPEAKIRDFFNNAGYSYRPADYLKQRKAEEEDRVEETDHTGVVGEYRLKRLADLKKRDPRYGQGKNRKPEKKDLTLTLLQMFYDKTGRHLFAEEAGPALPEQTPEQVEKLFDYLDRQKREDCKDVWIPLACDRTGCSLHLLGNGYYHATPKEKIAFVVFAPDTTQRPLSYHGYLEALDEDWGEAGERMADYAAARVTYRVLCEGARDDMTTVNAGGKWTKKLPSGLQKTFGRYWEQEEDPETYRQEVDEVMAFIERKDEEDKEK